MQIPEDQKKRLIARRTELFYTASDSLMESIFNGSVSIGEGQQQFKNLVRGLHTSVAAISKGGWSLMSPRDWGKIGPILRNEYSWMQQFFEYVSINRDTMSLTALKYRAKLYAVSANKSAISILAGFYIQDLLPWLPKDGSTECLFNCKCYWRLSIEELHESYYIVHATWTITDAEHCDTCLSRRNHLEVLRIPRDVHIPERIGGYD